MSKTRVGGGRVCVGGIDRNLGSLRLYEAGGQFPPGNSPYEVGQVWEMTYQPKPHTKPPPVEDVCVLERQPLGVQQHLADRLRGLVDTWQGDPRVLFDGLLRFTGRMRGYVEEPGVPNRSTGFWLPERDMRFLRVDGKAYYRYMMWDLSYVGVADPIDVIPAGTLVRVSLARWWRPLDAADGFPERCYLQLSGWYL